ncbi:ribonuclease P protein component [Candidatus Gottesmanbacteria bacterium]|nr:ribonuclease P protein component [Candidatus Gottesmanbacteria bacterium]
MLPRKNLIALKKEFSRIKASGKMYDSPSFGLLVSYQPPATSRQQPACAFIVSKKIAKSSVIRHQVKRKLADAIQIYLPRLPKNTELVFLAKQKATLATLTELKTEIKVLLNRIKIL